MSEEPKREGIKKKASIPEPGKRRSITDSVPDEAPKTIKKTTPPPVNEKFRKVNE
jgi:hypothetical protein